MLEKEIKNYVLVKNLRPVLNAVYRLSKGGNKVTENILKNACRRIGAEMLKDIIEYAVKNKLVNISDDAIPGITLTPEGNEALAMMIFAQ